MKLLSIISLFTALVNVNSLPVSHQNPLHPILASPEDELLPKFPHHRPHKDLSPVERAAEHVRRLVHFSNLATVTTIYQDGDRKGLPVGQVEYYADCIRDEDPDLPLTFIGLNISTVFKNVNKGSPASLAIRLGDTTPIGLTPISPAGSPRVSLFGEFIKHDGDKEAAKKCFLRSHHDAHPWIPGSDSLVHDSYWLKFNITGIHYIGGFGDKAYIGDIPVELYRNVTFRGKDEDHPQFTKKLKDWVQMTEHLAPNFGHKILPFAPQEGSVPKKGGCKGKGKGKEQYRASSLPDIPEVRYFKHAKHSPKHPDHNQHQHQKGEHFHAHKCADKNKPNWWPTRLSFVDKVKSFFSR